VERENETKMVPQRIRDHPYPPSNVLKGRKGGHLGLSAVTMEGGIKRKGGSNAEVKGENRRLTHLAS